MKRLTAFLLSCAIVICLCTFGCSANAEKKLMSEEMSQSLMEKYEEEIAYFSEKSGEEITSITHDTLSAMKTILVNDQVLLENEHFNALMQEIASAATMYRLETTANTIERRGGELRVVNVVTQAVTDYEPLRGKVEDYVPVSSKNVKEFEFSVSTGEEISGFAVLNVSVDVSHEVSGPDRNTYMSNGQAYATHNAVYGVFYGLIQKVDYDVLNIDTGGIVEHKSYYEVNKDTAKGRGYTLMVSYGNPTYVDHTRWSKTFSYSDALEFERDAEKNPSKLIN